ncbi:MAG: hypothetical protein R3E79_60950 [Caldilineaceae bacterium]
MQNQPLRIGTLGAARITPNALIHPRTGWRMSAWLQLPHVIR